MVAAGYSLDLRWLAVDDAQTLLQRLLQVHAAVHCLSKGKGAIAGLSAWDDGAGGCCHGRVAPLLRLQLYKHSGCTGCTGCSCLPSTGRPRAQLLNMLADVGYADAWQPCLVRERSNLLANAHELCQQVERVVDSDGAVHVKAHSVLYSCGRERR